MQRNTTTTFGELVTGDRFYFVSDKKKIAYQVTVERLINKSSYNIVDAEGSALWPFDKQAARDRPVIFLRHTILQPGQECRLYDLKQGDIFFFSNNIVTEYEVLDAKGVCAEEKYLVRAIKDENKQFWKGDTSVCYLGAKELQKS